MFYEKYGLRPNKRTPQHELMNRWKHGLRDCPICGTVLRKIVKRMDKYGRPELEVIQCMGKWCENNKWT